MFGRKVWGIDLGRSAVKGVLVGTSGRGGVRVYEADVVPFEGPPPQQGSAFVRDPRLWQALRVFNDRHALHNSPVAISVPAHSVLVRDLEVPSVGQKRIKELVRFEASNEIPFVLDEVMWDYTLFPPTPDDVTRKGFLLAIKKNVIEGYLRAFDELGIEQIETITVAPLALLNFVRLEMGGRGRALGVDIGAAGTSLVVADLHRFWMRTINAGGHRVTSVLQREFDLEFDDAEKAKQNIARSKMAARILEAARPSMDELARDVRQNLNYLSKSEDMGDLETACAVGGGARLVGMRKLLSISLGLPIESLREIHHVAVSSATDVEFVRENLDRLAVAVGAGIAGLRDTPEDVSFLPPPLQRAAQISKSRGLVLMAGLIAWAILLTAWAFSMLTASRVHSTAEEYRTLDARIAEMKSSLEAAKSGLSALEKEMNYLLAVGSGNEQFAALQDRVVSAFEQAGGRKYQFQITEFDCAEEDVESAGGHPGLIVGRVRGFVDADALNQEVNDLYHERILDRLRYGLRPSVADAGEAQVTLGKNIVTGKKGTRWTGYVKPGDYFMPLQADGQPASPKWYAIEEAKGSRIQLADPYEGESLEGPYMIARVQTLGAFVPEDFTVTFAVLREAPTTIDSIKAQ